MVASIHSALFSLELSILILLRERNYVGDGLWEQNGFSAESDLP